MHNLNDFELLSVWEQGYGRSASIQTWILLQAILPQSGTDMLNQMSVGQRNKLLFAFRINRFGAHINAVSQCLECNHQTEISFDIRAMQVWEAHTSSGDRLQIEHHPYRVHFRLPNTGDINSIVDLSDPRQCREELLNRCILTTEYNGEDISPEGLPDEVLNELSEKMENSDPLAVIRLEVTCPYCQHQWETTFDIAAFLLHEIDSWAKRLLTEIHILAESYHWAETDILAMGQWRRQIYLSMVNG